MRKINYIHAAAGRLFRPVNIQIVIILTVVIIFISFFNISEISHGKTVAVSVPKVILKTTAGSAGAYELANAYRRQQVIDATWRVIGRNGITGASLRNIAEDMGLTTGFVTRYFPEKEALLLASLEGVVALLGRDIVDASANHTQMARVEAAVMAALPVTDESLSAWRVWVAFLGALPGEPGLATAHTVFPDQLRQILVQGLREAQLAGQIAPHIYPPQLADMLLNQIIGLGVRAVSDPARYPGEKLPGLIAPFFARLLK